MDGGWWRKVSENRTSGKWQFPLKTTRARPHCNCTWKQCRKAALEPLEARHRRSAFVGFQWEEGKERGQGGGATESIV